MKNITEDTDIIAEADLEECMVRIKINQSGKYLNFIDLDYDTCIAFRNQINKQIEKINSENFMNRCF